jgi:hypothetical protein
MEEYQEKPFVLPPMRIPELAGMLEVEPVEKKFLIHAAALYTTEEKALRAVALANFARWKLSHV